MWGRIISTHALTEGDLEFFGLLKGDDISTHALTEGDHQPAATGSPVSYFNSRPHGGRLHWLFFFAHQAIFQLTPSRRVTLKLSKGGRLTIISTHALTEGDADIFCRFLRQKISTHALTEGDLGQSFHRCCRSCISTHALTEGD